MNLLWSSSQDVGTTKTLYNLPFDAVIKVRVMATNGAGAGPWSDPNADQDSARVRQRPAKMDPPRQDQKISVLPNQIAIYWDQLSIGGLPSGGSPITEYVLDENAGNGWTNVRDDMSTTFIKKNATAKKEYKFRIAAKNIYGTGPKSDPITLSTGQRPSAPNSISAVNPKLANGALDYDNV